MKQSEPLTKNEYPTPHNYNPEEYIKKLVLKDENYVETVTEPSGRAGKPKEELCEIVY